MTDGTPQRDRLGELLTDFTENGFSRQGNYLLEADPGGAPCNVLAAPACTTAFSFAIVWQGDLLCGYPFDSACPFRPPFQGGLMPHLNLAD